MVDGLPPEDGQARPRSYARIMYAWLYASPIVWIRINKIIGLIGLMWRFQPRWSTVFRQRTDMLDLYPKHSSYMLASMPSLLSELRFIRLQD